MTEENKPQDFEIKDRRSSAASEAQVTPPLETAAAPEPKTAPNTKEESGSRARAAGHNLHEVTFTTFILSLSTSAFVSLGEIPDPTTGQTESNLSYANQIIDILGIIKEKTRGNLQKEEEMLLDGLLYDLRMKYLEKTHQVKL